METASRKFILILINHYCGAVRSIMNGMLVYIAYSETVGVHIAVNINVKIYVVKLQQNILDHHLRYADLIFLKLQNTLKDQNLIFRTITMALQLKCKENNTKNISISFIEEIPITLPNSKHGINSRKNYAKRTRLH